MVGTGVTNHYEVLGIDPAAGLEDIKRAFAAKMSLFGAHRLAEAPAISAAFEILRDPPKRQAYDAALGLNAKPAPQGWGFAVPPPRWTPFMASTAIDEAPAPEPHVTIEPVDPRAAAIAASLREVAKPAAPVAAAEPTGEAELEGVLDHIRAYGRGESQAPRNEGAGELEASGGGDRRDRAWSGVDGRAGRAVGQGQCGSAGGTGVSVALPPAKEKADLAAAVPLPEPVQVPETAESA